MKHFAAAAAIGTTITLAACSGGMPTSPDPVIRPGNSSLAGPRVALETAGGETLNDSDLRFVQYAWALNEALIEFGKMAQARGDLPEVKFYGLQSTRAHTSSRSELGSILPGYPPTTSFDTTNQERHAQLSRLSGSSFDRAFVATQVQLHEEALERFQREGMSSSALAIRQYVADTRARLTTQLRELRDIAGRTGAPARATGGTS